MSDPQGGPGPVELNLTSDSSQIAEVRAQVETFAREMGFDASVASSIALAVDEALCNVIKHGYRGTSGHPIQVRLHVIDTDRGRGLQVTIEDECDPVEPASLAGRELDDVRPGGLGLHIMKTIMDEVEHGPRGDRGMRLRMVKLLTAEERTD